MAIFLASCSPTKNLQENQVYLKSTQIKIPPNIIEPEQIAAYQKQHANTRAMWVVKLKMQQYLAFDDAKLEKRNEKKRIKHQIKNEKRVLAGKDSVEFKPVLFARIKADGEAPVVFDSLLAHESVRQFEKALFNKGYFNNLVYTKFEYSKDTAKVKVIYETIEGRRYFLNKINIVIEDTNLRKSVKVANEESLLHKGGPFDTDVIDSERERFASQMRNLGYYFFSKEYLTYEIDSANTNYTVNLNIKISNPQKKANDSLNTPTHIKYKIGTIALNTSFSPKYPNNPTDSIHFENLVFINLSHLEYKPHSFVNKLFFSSGDYYSELEQSKTYTRLSGLNNFKYINIGFSTNDVDSNILDCTISMTPFPKQTIGFEVEGTNSSSNLGVSGYLTYMHRNMFRNSTQLRVRLKGGLEAQQTNSASTDATDNSLINTKELGIETMLTFQDLIAPRFIREKILKNFNRPKTSLTLLYNYQNRPDFERYLNNASIGYFFTQKKNNINEFFVYPIDISYIQITQSDDFKQRLKDLNNPMLNATYADQFIAGIRILENWTNKQKVSQRNFALNRSQFSLAGNILNALSGVFNYGTGADTTSDGMLGTPYETVGGIRYAQFIKLQNDLSLNTRINRTQSMAYRFLGGIGIAYGNSIALPYDRSFYGGGANDNRGWRARTLGPGSMSDELKVGVDQVADIKIQISGEYRFKIYKSSIEGALFGDLGNIWLLREDPDRPGANFELNRFMNEFALSAGPGIRFNFGFLLIRLDWGVKIYNPGVGKDANGEDLNRFIWGGNISKESVLNLGIGYPF